jgi:hypothetical protein
MYQLKVQLKGTTELVSTSWSPRSYKSARALFHYYSRTWPEHSYWLAIVD